MNFHRYEDTDTITIYFDCWDNWVQWANDSLIYWWPSPLVGTL
jgi:hypothetical protein